MHSSNPVAWQSWSEESFQLAKKLKRPIFLSSGYLSCHWCKVMEKESFQNNEIAEILNEYFIPIKLDKDEYPGIDKIYQFYLQSTGVQGGWPLSVFLDTDLKPFYAGTYFPSKTSNGEFTTFKDILNKIIKIYKNNYDEIRKVISIRDEFIEELYSLDNIKYSPISEHVEVAITEFKNIFDNSYGGFREASKFPYVPALLLLLDYANEDDTILSFLELTADNMIKGGLYDHINGGFFRYTVDRKWLEPHFEKMLIDNALISKFLLKLFDLTENRLYLYIARQCIDFVINNMMSDYGLLNSIDADSLDKDRLLVEGYYYKVNDRLFSSLSKDELNVLIDEIEVNNGVISLKHAEYIKVVAMQPIFTKVAEKIESVRIKPMLDNKMITSNNLIFCTTLLFAFESTSDEYYLEYAKLLFAKITEHATENNQVFRGSYADQMMTHQSLEDYVAYLECSLIFFDITKEKAFFHIADRTIKEISNKFMRENGLLSINLSDDLLDTFDDDKPNPISTYYYLSILYSDILDFNISTKLTIFLSDKALKFPTGHPTLFRQKIDR